MNLETKITIYKFTPQVFTLTRFAAAGSTARNCKTRNTTCCCNIIQDAIAEKQQGNITFILRIRDAKSRFNFF